MMRTKRPSPSSIILPHYDIIVLRYNIAMITSFACKETEKIYHGQRSKKLPSGIQRTARRKLIYLDEAEVIEDLKAPPANDLEKRKKDRKGQWSIRINNQWRICFKWMAPNASNVEIVDYH